MVSSPCWKPHTFQFICGVPISPQSNSKGSKFKTCVSPISPSSWVGQLIECMLEYTRIKCRYRKGQATSQLFPRLNLWGGSINQKHLKPSSSARWPEVMTIFNILFVFLIQWRLGVESAHREYISTGTVFISKCFILSRGKPFCKDYTLIHSLCIWWDRWCIRCITGILQHVISEGWGGSSYILLADIDLAELCFWLPWQISSKWKLITLCRLQIDCLVLLVTTARMTNEQIWYIDQQTCFWIDIS